MSFNLFVVRHGQTFLNKYHRMQGWSDAPLTDSGIADAFAAGERLSNVKFDGVYSSDLTRAIKTAEGIMSRNLHQDGPTEPTPMSNFREVFFGTYEGLPGDQIAQQIGDQMDLPEPVATYGELIKVLGASATMDAFAETDPYNDAEDAAAFWRRFDEGIDTLRRYHRDGQNVLVVAHGIVARNLADRYMDGAAFDQVPENGMVSIWEVNDDTIVNKVYNDTTTKW